MNLFKRIKQLIKKERNLIPKFPGLVVSPLSIRNDPRKTRVMALPMATKLKPAEFFSYWATKHINQVEYDQDSQPSCVAESGSRYVGTLSFKENGTYIKPSVEGLMAYIKSRIEKDTGWGAMIDSSPKAIEKYGVPIETDFPTNYALSWKDFVNDVTISQAAQQNGLKNKIKTYAWTEDSHLESIKIGIYFGEGNIVHGAAIGSNSGWATGNVRIPKAGETIWGHSISFFGYDENYIYFTNSWSWKWGLTLYLKLVENEFGKYYIKGTNSDYNIIIKGIGVMGKDYEQLDSSNDPYLYRGMTYVDLPDTPNPQTNMLKIIGDKSSGKQFLQGVDGKLRWIFNEKMLEELNFSGIIDKNSVDWRENIDGMEIANPWCVICVK